MNDRLKKEIDDMSYEQMLRHWRFSRNGNPMFEGEIGIYFKKTMMEKKSQLSQDQLVRISKEIGWE